MAERTVRWRGNREVVQLQLVPLLPVDVVQHLLQHLGSSGALNSHSWSSGVDGVESCKMNACFAYLNENRKLLEVEGGIDGLRQQGRHNPGRHNIHGQSVAFIAQHDPVDV